MSYVHLTECERNVIYNMKYLEYSVIDIARAVCKSRATIYREINRNANSDGRYIPDVAQIKANSRAVQGSQSQNRQQDSDELCKVKAQNLLVA